MKRIPVAVRDSGLSQKVVDLGCEARDLRLECRHARSDICQLLKLRSVGRNALLSGGQLVTSVLKLLLELLLCFRRRLRHLLHQTGFFVLQSFDPCFLLRELLRTFSQDAFFADQSHDVFPETLRVRAYAVRPDRTKFCEVGGVERFRWIGACKDHALYLANKLPAHAIFRTESLNEFLG